MELFIGVKALIISNGKVLLLKRSEVYKEKNKCWDIPGGRMLLGEEPLVALSREVFEETGLNVVRVERILDASTIFLEGGKQIVRITYLCTASKGEVRLSFEHTEARWIDPDRIDFEIEDRLLEKCLRLIKSE